MCGGKQVIGSVAVERPQAGADLQGVVLHKNFQLTIVSVDEIAQHAGLQVAQVILPIAGPNGFRTVLKCRVWGRVFRSLMLFVFTQL